jgi:hypothetical protein
MEITKIILYHKKQNLYLVVSNQASERDLQMAMADPNQP